MRLVMTRVFPDPAPARISSGPLMCRTASRCSGLSVSKNCIGDLGTRELGDYEADPRMIVASSLVSPLVPESPAPIPALFDRHRLREVPRLIDVAAAADRDVVGEQLKRQRHHDRTEQLR